MAGWPCYTKEGVPYTKCGECGKETEANNTNWFDDKLLCLPCHNSVTAPLIESFAEEYEEGACDWNDDIKCPYCGHDNDTADAFDGGEPTEWTCGRCGLDFDVEVEYSYSFKSILKENS